MIDYEIIPILILIVAVVIIIVLELLKNNFKIGMARTVIIRNDGKTCEPVLGELSVIPNRECETSDGRTVRCYQPDPSIDLKFEISPTPFYYRSICNRLCGEININGVCDEENSLYNFCLNLLEPSEGCNNSANPLGRLTDTNSVYYAKSVI